MQVIRWYNMLLALGVLMNVPAAIGMGLNLSGNLIVTPPECILNNSQQQAVHFSDILLTRIDGVNYQRPLMLNLNCPQLVKNAIKLTIVGNTVNMNSRVLLSTSNSKLGVTFYVNDVNQPINQAFNVNYTALPTIKAAPVKNATANYNNTDGGAFTALATLKVDYQ
ncbi:TPA: fimbrial protein [Providencia rettgeri]